MFAFPTCVAFIERMPARTACARFSRHPAKSRTPAIFGESDGLKVSRVHTSAIAAEVVQCQAIRDAALGQFIRNTVGKAIAAVPQEATVPGGA
jgi:hypothetical protein